ncbi:hypothetical protein ACWKT5_22095 [Streptomyces avermitilis]
MGRARIWRCIPILQPSAASTACPGPTPRHHSTQLRQGRFLDEARETADPIRLMRLFGSTSRTAIHYVRAAAHPECLTIDPTQV